MCTITVSIVVVAVDVVVFANDAAVVASVWQQKKCALYPVLRIWMRFILDFRISFNEKDPDSTLLIILVVAC